MGDFMPVNPDGSYKIDESDEAEYFSKPRESSLEARPDLQVSHCVDDLRALLKRFRGSQSAGLVLPDSVLRSSVLELKTRYGRGVFNEAYALVTFEHMASHSRDFVREASDVKRELSRTGEEFEE